MQKSEVADINWTEQEIDRLKELINEGYTNKEIAIILSNEYGREFTKTSVKSKRQRLNKVTPPRTVDGQSINENKRYNIDGTISQAEFDVKMAFYQKDSKTPEDILKYKGYDPDEWEISQVTTNEWTTTAAETQKWNQQLKFVIKPKHKSFNASAFTDSIEPVKLTSIKTGDRNLFIGLADWHFGITKLEDLQDKLARMIDVISKGYKQIVIGQLGDLFHSSQIKKSVTMAGTQLDDVDMEQAIKDARSFFDVLITECVRHSKQVTIEHAGGNHSENLEYMFLLYLEAKYPDIKVNYHNKYRQAFMLDNVAIMITHGQYGKRKDLPMLFATEFSDIWSKATTREIITGHFHTQQTNDYQGVIHRQLGTIKPNDSYEIENGWTMGKKVLQLFEYDSERLRVTYDI
ncbi:helix-turn-helix domain-containing protein [Enterococcus casseliflavus]|uniref:helix-turn-helix domain-containing protein n=1 Tax=Enterococcus casseliflavus TaxID=37734 RepID=UPI001C471C8A|nr:helix-turn-helix domain-containing protein [Enterococcus casseliflavus]MBV6373850.1 helix-turn-helix domain-containing protein [Enterococcus casseliflavus]